ncbi:hypothetical protein A4H97_13020 [Niastella yeongjuensis]|uniref:DUF4197 domain-containing protein n=1 Tax=Niastella yeongjuensis TaxID=354355 RepID=A0A1V9EAB8_9BACT|nr:DUF4197 domain-containing protein [Niastella yeongjuensis]OQP43060.1 hypothetical protein A4H97_13020 [Niastella yeongjuensis]SEO64932.1 Protein of unknown function [Niastella yeongjuensis]
MKRIIQLLSCVLLLSVFTGCESTQQIIKTIEQNYPAAAGTGTGTGLSTADIVAGLKQALEVGAQNSGNQLSALDGFFKNAAIKILLPEEAQKVEKTLRDLGMGSLVDKAVLSLNRAAEDATKSAAPIFVDAIKSMTISDALGILKGGDMAATNFLKTKTTSSLTSAFKPVIQSSLDKVSATKYWGDVFTTYNKFATNKINPDLSGFVTDKAITGIFYQVGLEEQKIRKDPVSRVTDLLKKVFGSKEAQGS